MQLMFSDFVFTSAKSKFSLDATHIKKYITGHFIFLFIFFSPSSIND